MFLEGMATVVGRGEKLMEAARWGSHFCDDEGGWIGVVKVSIRGVVGVRVLGHYAGLDFLDRGANGVKVENKGGSFGFGDKGGVEVEVKSHHGGERG